MRKAGSVSAAHATIAFLLANSAPASADVLEIAADGHVIVRAGAASADRANGEDDGAEADDLPQPAQAIPAAYVHAVDRMAERYDISPALIEALVWQESRWRQQAVSPAGAVGLTQLMPATARNLRVDPRNPVANLEGGARYLRNQLDLFDGDIEKALAAYNAGPGRVLRAGGIPPIAETRAYVAAIVGRLSQSAKGD
jgi:soluble lytic murein transglycosylase-like protein